MRRPLADHSTAQLLAVLDRHRKTAAQDPGNKFSVTAIATITDELDARR